MFVSILTYRGIDLSTDVPSGVVDQEYDGATGFAAGSYGYPAGIGQTVTFGPNPSEVTGFRAKLGQSNVPFPKNVPGMVRCAVFEENGNNQPTGSREEGTPVVFSPYYAIDGQTNQGFSDYYFPLSGWTPTENTKYVFVLQFFGQLTPAGFQANAGYFGVLYTNVDSYSGGQQTLASAYYRSATELASYGNSFNPNTSTRDLSFTVYSVRGSGPRRPVRFRPVGIHRAVIGGIGNEVTIRNN